VPITCVDIANREVAELYQRKLVLVRPDGHVCWCADAPPQDPSRLIDTIRGET